MHLIVAVYVCVGVCAMEVVWSLSLVQAGSAQALPG